MNTASDHWNKVWADFTSFNDSWPDSYARALELSLIERHLLACSPHGRVIELGCGPFTLSESTIVGLNVARNGYHGFDISEAACHFGRYLATPFQRFDGDYVSFATCDLNQFDSLPAEIISPAHNDFLICRRILINLTPGTNREALISHILEKFHHGIIIETPASSMDRINRLRSKYSLPTIKQQPFNNWLCDRERLLLDDAAARTHWFMGLYFKLTRNKTLSGYNTAYHEHAYHCQLKDVTNSHPYGLCAWTW